MHAEPIDLPLLRQWIDKTEVSRDVVRAGAANALAATLGRPSLAAGDGLPPLWH